MTNIVTVTLNPAIDQTVVLETLRPGQVHRARAALFHAGGKGVNVASCLADWGGGPITATGFLGQDNKAIFQALFTEKHIADRFILVPGQTRTNIKISHDGDTTDLNLPGQAVAPQDVERLRDAVRDCVAPGTIVLLAGSVPAGVDAAIYAELTAAIKQSGARVVLDSSGAPLAAALDAKILPDCIKPNQAELESFAGQSLDTPEKLLAAAAGLQRRGVALVVISMGAQGALFVGKRALLAALPSVRAASSVGAGDAMVAGIIAALRDRADLEQTARLATAFAVAKLGQAGPNLPAREIVQALAAKVAITELQGAET